MILFVLISKNFLNNHNNIGFHTVMKLSPSNPCQGVNLYWKSFSILLHYSGCTRYWMVSVPFFSRHFNLLVLAHPVTHAQIHCNLFIPHLKLIFRVPLLMLRFAMHMLLRSHPSIEAISDRSPSCLRCSNRSKWWILLPPLLHFMRYLLSWISIAIFDSFAICNISNAINRTARRS